MAARVHAPGRVNLIGEHTDYSGGLVLPVAIQLGVTVTFDPGERLELAAPGGERLAAAVEDELRALGRPAVGIRGTVDADLPQGAGLGSSGAFEVAVALALCEAGSFAPEPFELVRACQRAEQHATGVPSGILDQAASLLGRAGNALLLDCGTLEHRWVRLPDELTIVVLDSGERRALGDSGYAQRRRELEAGDPRRVRHVRTENERVRKTVAALERGDVAALGAIFAASHASLRDDYEVSTPTLDALVAAALDAGALAARMTGGGFGGSVVALAEPSRAADVLSRPGVRGWFVRASDGAGRVAA
ncbi:MAG TPA: galactokinase family protein [Gaiellaceae bacterium]|nr:galactokinase family protein [Gaiellaceae bacterium]